MFAHNDTQADLSEVSFSAFIQHFSTHESYFDDKGCLDVNRPDDRLRTHLHRAVIKNRYGVVEGLLRMPYLNANKLDKDGATALSLAI